MSDLIGPGVGATIGFMIAGPTGAQWGWAIGGVAGSMLFPDELEGPRIQDLSVQSSTYGVPIPVVYGTVRTAGNVIWATDLVEHATEEGGKGGPTYTTYSYTASFAVAICEGEIDGVQKIWANGDLIFDVSAANTGPTGFSGASRGRAISYIGDLAGRVNCTVYKGSETQTADPRMQAELGAANVPAYRGLAYVVFEDMLLEKYGNRIPNLTFQVVKSGTLARPDPQQLTTTRGTNQAIYDAYTNRIVYQTNDRTGLVFFDCGSGEEIHTTALPDAREAWRLNYAKPGTFWVVDEYTIPFRAYSYSFATMGLLDTVALPNQVSHGAWNHLNREMILASSNVYDFVDVFNPDTWTNYTIPTSSPGSNWGAICVIPWGYSTVANPSRRPGWVVLHNGEAITLLDETYSVRLIYECSPSSTLYGDNASHIAYDPVRDCVYISQYSSSELYVVDMDTLTVTKHAVYAGSYLTYHAQLDALVGVGTGASVQYIVFDLDDLPNTIASFTVAATTVPYLSGWPIEVDGDSDAVYLVSSDATSKGLWRVPLFERLDDVTQPLSEVVQDQCVRAGLAAGDLDVTDLASTAVNGYLVSRQAAARANIEPLQVAYFFDAVESDDVLKFVKRGGASAATIPEDDLGGYEYGTTAPPLLEQTRAQETELPRTVSVNYLNPATEYQQGTQYDRRLTGSANIETTLSLPLALSDDDGARIASVNLYTAWANRSRVKFSTSLKYTMYEPTDVLGVTKGNTVHTLRIVAKNEGGNGLIAWEAVSEDTSVYSQSVTGAAALSMPTQTIALPVMSRLELMDIPLLRDGDDGAGFYYAICGYRTGWDGAQLYRSTDGGASWTAASTTTNESTIGDAVTALGDWAGGYVVDEHNSVNVRLANTGLALSSVSLANLLDGNNACLLGDEVMGFRDATLEADGSYTLTGLLRGLRGTQWAMSTHAAGDRFVLFSTSTTRRYDSDSADISLARNYKAVSFYTTLAQAVDHDLTNAANGLKPYAPAHVGSGRDASGNITINWVRCTRIGGEWRDYVDASQPEAAVEYELEFWSEDGATLVRTVTGITSETYSYTTALADFPTSSAALLKVYQVSATLGRGYAATYTLPLFTITEYSTDFSEYTTGVQPSDWTAGWNTGNFTALVQESGGVKYLKITNTADARGLLSWDLPGTFADGEIIAKIKAVGRSTTSSSYAMNMVCLRAGGATGSENNYRFALDRYLSGSAVSEYVAGVSTSLSTNASPTWTLTEWRWMRLQVIGTTIKARTWADGDTEPTTWLISTTDGSLASGLAGLSLFDSGNDMEVAEVTVRVLT